MTKTKFIKWSVCVAASCLLFALLGPCARDSFNNSWNLGKIQKALREIPIPSNTQRLASNSAVGLLVGNGNHCDFFAGEIFRSELPADAILQHYTNRLILNPVTSDKEEIGVRILTNATQLSSLWLPDRFTHPDAWGVSTDTFSNATIYLVSVMRSYDANHDVRCH